MADTQEQVQEQPTPYVVALTPEQHEARLRQAASAPKEPPPPRPQIEMGGTGTAKASFKDAAGGDVEITSSAWSSTGALKVTPVEDDPTSATLEPTGLGPATVTVIGSSEFGSWQTSTDVMVIDKVGAPVAGTIEITVEAPAEAPPETSE